MNVLMVVHQFLPKHLAGTELYTYHLAKALQRRGHRIHLFFTEIRPDRSQYMVSRGAYDGLPYVEAVHNHHFPSFEHSYRDREMEGLFQDVLNYVRPNIVHVQHLQFHSVGYIDVAKRRGLPLVYTLHEYILMCLRDGLLLRPGDVPCPGPEPRACAHCATSEPRTAKPLRIDRRMRPLVSLAVRNAALFRLARTLWRRAHPPGARANNGSNGYVAAVEERRRTIQAQLDHVDLFLAPSRFLQQRFVEAALIRSERIVHSPYGLDRERFADVQRRPSDVLRVGFIGTIAKHKGVHLIVEAFREIQARNIECKIYGDLDYFPDYVRQLQETPASPQLRYMGRLDPSDVTDALAQLDLLIVPSIWYENAPLTIQEAFLAGVPVLTADAGGMAELVADGINGLHFRLGDAADLREKILRCAREPSLLARLREQIPPVKSVEQDADLMEERYALLLRDQVPVR